MPQLGVLLRKHKLASKHSGAEDFVLGIVQGKPMSHRRSSELWDEARTAAGIEIDLHELRHTFASHLILDLKLDVVQVSRQLGHSSPTITLNVYAHLFDQARHAEETRAAMEQSDFGRLLGGI
jgi:integrase